MISFNSRCEIDLMLKERIKKMRTMANSGKNVNRIGCSSAGKSIQEAM